MAKLPKCVAAGMAVLAISLACAQDLQRGFRNYQDILSGRKKLEQLSAPERDEVIRIHRAVQAKRGGEGGSPECRNARSEASDKASDLADSARRLQSCAESEDFSDDCSSEFSRTRSAQDDYESAVSDVSSYCQ